jgi:hypothetical protein
MAPAPPQFCPWCGTPIGYEEHEHQARHELLSERARERGREPAPLPKRIGDLLSGESYVGTCPGCRTISHVVGHRSSGR